MLGLAVFIAAGSANAQTAYSSEVEIPFAFSVCGQSFEAGKYSLKLVKLDAGSATISVTDQETREVKSFLARRSGDGPANDVALVFDTARGTKVLRRISTPGGGFELNGNTEKSDRVASLGRFEFVEASDLF